MKKLKVKRSDNNNQDFQLIDIVNWKDFTYKPEVSFQIAHSGKTINLKYHLVYS